MSNSNLCIKNTINKFKKNDEIYLFILSDNKEVFLGTGIIIKINEHNFDLKSFKSFTDSHNDESHLNLSVDGYPILLFRHKCFPTLNNGIYTNYVVNNDKVINIQIHLGVDKLTNIGIEQYNEIYNKIYNTTS